MEDDEFEYAPSFTTLKFPAADAKEYIRSTHDPVNEVKRLFEKVKEEVEELRQHQPIKELEAEVDETTLPRELRQDILSLYTLSTSLIEKYAVELLIREFVATTHRRKEGSREVFERRGVSANLRLLLDIGVLDNGLHGELQSVTGDRNDYAHDPDSTLFIEDYDQFLSRSRRCVRATKGLAVILDGEDLRNW